MAIAIYSSVDWAATGAMLSGCATLIGALAVIYAAHKGADTFKQWRWQKHEERRIELAEQVLTLAYRLRRAIDGLRSEGMLQAENAEVHDLLRSNGVIDDQTPLEKVGKLVIAQSVMSRSNNQRPIWDALLDTMPSAKAIFGDNIETALDEFWKQRNRILAAAQSYARFADVPAPRTEKMQTQQDAQRDRIESIIWPGGDVDAIADLINDAIKSLEDTMLPIIRSDTPFGTAKVK